jgi:hypothetical protein
LLTERNQQVTYKQYWACLTYFLPTLFCLILDQPSKPLPSNQCRLIPLEVSPLQICVLPSRRNFFDLLCFKDTFWVDLNSISNFLPHKIILWGASMKNNTYVFYVHIYYTYISLFISNCYFTCFASYIFAYCFKLWYSIPFAKLILIFYIQTCCKLLLMHLQNTS